MKAKKNNGYSEELASIYVPKDTDIVLLSSKLEPRVKWENHKPTDEITGYRVLCGMPDNYFYVKFEKKVKLPPYRSSVKFKHLQACEVDNNVWFKAEDIEEG